MQTTKELDAAIVSLRVACNAAIKEINEGNGTETPGFATINRLLKRCDAVFAAHDSPAFPAAKG